jgi:hypothetical protein
MIGFIHALYNQLVHTHKQQSAIADLQNVEFAFAHALGSSVSTSRILVTELQESHCD